MPTPKKVERLSRKTKTLSSEIDSSAAEELFNKISTFRGFSEEDIATFAELFSVMTFAKGQTVVAEGEPGLAPAPARHAGAARHHGLLGLEDARLRARRAGRRERDERRRGAVGAGAGQREQAAQCPHRIPNRLS